MYPLACRFGDIRVPRGARGPERFALGIPAGHFVLIVLWLVSFTVSFCSGPALFQSLAFLWFVLVVKIVRGSHAMLTIRTNHKNAIL
jgi:hypothetical protein